MLIQPLAPAPHGPVGHPHDLGRFPPLQLARDRLQYHFLRLHHPLDFCGRYLLFVDFHTVQLFPPAILKRTFHLLIEADKSHVTDSAPAGTSARAARSYILTLIGQRT